METPYYLLLSMLLIYIQSAFKVYVMAKLKPYTVADLAGECESYPEWNVQDCAEEGHRVFVSQ